MRKLEDSPLADLSALSGPIFSEPPNKKKDKDRKQASFRKRCSTIFRKADQMRRICDAEVYFLVRYRDRYYLYTSSEASEWPPTKTALVVTLHVRIKPNIDNIQRRIS